MEYTGIGKEKEEFVPRKSAEEFFRDGEVIEELYEWTNKLICEELNVTSHPFTQYVFNQAYRTCWMISAKIVPVGRIENYIQFENETIGKHSLAVALSLLRFRF